MLQQDIELHRAGWFRWSNIALMLQDTNQFFRSHTGFPDNLNMSCTDFDFSGNRAGVYRRKFLLIKGEYKIIHNALAGFSILTATAILIGSNKKIAFYMRGKCTRLTDEIRSLGDF